MSLFLLFHVLLIYYLVLVYFQIILNQHLLNLSLKKITLDSNDIKNYSPISNLSFLSKLIERVVANQLQLHLSFNGLMSEYQSTYRKFYSFETALLRVQNDILVFLDSGHSIALLLLDLSAAFDPNDHKILLHRLKHWFGNTSCALSSLSSFFTNRF